MSAAAKPFVECVQCQVNFCQAASFIYNELIFIDFNDFLNVFMCTFDAFNTRVQIQCIISLDCHINAYVIYASPLRIELIPYRIWLCHSEINKIE